MIKKQIHIISIVLALIGIAGEWIWIFLPYTFKIILIGTETRALLYFSFLSSLCFSGLIIGIIAIKSNKKIAIGGIFLSLIGLMIGIFFIMVASGFIRVVP